MPERETSAEIDETAAEWALRIDDAALSREEQAELDSWLQGDIRRVGAFARAQAVLIHAKRAKALGTEFEPESYGFDGNGPENVEAITESAPAAILTRRRMLFGAFTHPEMAEPVLERHRRIEEAFRAAEGR